MDKYRGTLLSVTLELHSPTIFFVIISGYNVPLSQFITVCCRFYTILNYFLLRKSDVIKITRTHSMAMMIVMVSTDLVKLINSDKLCYLLNFFLLVIFQM